MYESCDEFPDVPSEKVLEAKHDFYASVGQALSDAVRLEQSMGRLLQEIMRGADRVAVGFAFARIRSFEDKLDVIAKCLNSKSLSVVADESAFRQEWKDLRKDLTKRNLFRNELAHGHVETLYDLPNDGRVAQVYFVPFPGEVSTDFDNKMLYAYASGTELPPRRPANAISLAKINDYIKGHPPSVERVDQFRKRVLARTTVGQTVAQSRPANKGPFELF